MIQIVQKILNVFHAQDWIFGEMRYGRKLEAGYGVKVGWRIPLLFFGTL